MKKKGSEGKLYYSATALETVDDDGVSGATWIELGKARDSTSNSTKDKIDVTSRDSTSGYKQYLPSWKDGSIEFEMVWDTGNDDLAALLDAYENDTLIGLADMDGSITAAGNSGLAGNFYITDATRSKPLNDAMTVKFTATPYECFNYVVAGASSSG